MSKFRYINRMQVGGLIGNEPILRQLPNGDAVIELSVATQTSWRTKDGEWKTHTEWHQCVAYRSIAEEVAYYKKGNGIYIEGRVVTREWLAKDNSLRKRTEIVIDDYHPILIEDKKESLKEAEQPESGEVVPINQSNDTPSSAHTGVWDSLM